MTRLLLALLLTSCAIGNDADEHSRGECRRGVPRADTGYCPDQRHTLAVVNGAVVCVCGGKGQLM